MTADEWAPIPGFKNYEVNKNGVIRNAQTKKIHAGEGFGPTVLRYSNDRHPLKVAMKRAMSEAFGDLAK